METPTKLNPTAILAALKEDLRAAERQKRDIDAKISQWRSEYEGLPYGNEVKGKSAIVSRDVKKQSEWQHASIIDPFVSTDEIVRCLPVTWEDKQAAEQNEILLNTQFCRQFPRYNFMSKAIKLLDIEGTLVVQTGWDYTDRQEEVEREVVAVDEFGNEFITTEVVTETIVERNQPTARICRSQDVYLDPTCYDDADNAQFFIHRYESDLSTLRADGRYKNLDKVARLYTDISSSTDYMSPDETSFKFQDEPRRKLLVYEYWGNYDVDGDGIAEPIVCVWVDDIILRLEGNPYPDGKPPFLVVPFNSIPFKLHGESNAELIGVNQKVKTAILRGMLDNMAQSNNAQVGVRKGALDQVNRNRFRNNQNFEFSGTPQDFWQGSYNSIPGSVFDMVALMNNEIESLTGFKSFAGGISASGMGSTATAARGILDATAMRRMNIVRNISENLIKPLMRKWMAYNAVFLEEEEVIRVTNEEFVPIRRDDLKGLIDITIQVSTAEDNASKAEELSFLLQTIGPTEDPEIRRQVMASILKLMRMPEEAKMLLEYQPEEDPLAAEAAQLEIENIRKANILLEAQIQREIAMAELANYDMLLRKERAGTEAARARKYDSEADSTDLDFLMKEAGIDEQRRVAHDERHRRLQLELIQIQKEAGDKSIGIMNRQPARPRY